MPVNRKPIFDAVKQLRNGQAFVSSEVILLDKAIDEAIATGAPDPKPLPQSQLVSLRSNFKLGEKSLAELEPVHPQLAACVKLAIGISAVDFRVNQGRRTLEEQKTAVAEGHSRTMKSKHLLQADGHAWAVDLVVLINGQVSWEFKQYAAIAFAMDKAATALGIAQHIRWGCAWDRVLSDFGGTADAYLKEASAYAARHAGSDLLDAPHFEWVA